MADINPKAMTGAMADANAKPVAGASEPHELGERAAKELARLYGLRGAPSIPRWKSHKLKSPEEYANLVWQQFADDARAVLNLVRQDQERPPSEPMLSAATDTGFVPHDCDWDDFRRWYDAMIRAWWLSHTAKETSNG